MLQQHKTQQAKVNWRSIRKIKINKKNGVKKDAKILYSVLFLVESWPLLMRKLSTRKRFRLRNVVINKPENVIHHLKSFSIAV